MQLKIPINHGRELRGNIIIMTITLQDTPQLLSDISLN